MSSSTAWFLGERSLLVGATLSVLVGFTACDPKRMLLFVRNDPVDVTDAAARDNSRDDVDDDLEPTSIPGTQLGDDDAPPSGGDSDEPEPASTVGGEPMPSSSIEVGPPPEPSNPTASARDAGSSPTPTEAPTANPPQEMPRDGGSGGSPDSSLTTPEPRSDAGPPPSTLDGGGARPDFVLIDDFEDDDIQAIAGGWWYGTTDTTAGALVLETNTANRTDSQYALHVAGSGYTDWGVIIGLDLRGMVGYFDADPTNAVSFWARASDARTMVLRLLQADGGSFTTEVPLGTEWDEYTVPFSDFVGAGDAGVLDERSIGHLHFYFGVDAFEAWFDDVAFVTL